jgi:hypothetical protein
MLNICIVFAQLERETIQQRVFDAYHSRNKKGFYMGGPVPYGFKKESTVINGIKTSKLVIDEVESSHIKMMYSMYADGSNSLNDIVKYLVNNNIKHTRGRTWSTSYVSIILSSPLYVQADMSVYDFFKSQGANIINDVSDYKGQGCYLFTGTVSKSRKQRDLTDKEVVLAPHDGFIPSNTWLKCKLRCLNNRCLAKTNKGVNSWLIGKVKCGNCGYAVLVRFSGSNRTRYGFCSHKLVTHSCDGTGNVIHFDVVEDNIFNAIKDKLTKYKSLSDYTKNEVNPKVKENELKLIQIDNEINDLLTKVTGANTVLMDYINKKIEELDKKRKELQQENISITQATKTDKFNTVYKHLDNWNNTSFEDKQSVVDILIKVIHIKNGEIAISWNV